MVSNKQAKKKITHITFRWRGGTNSDHYIKLSRHLYWGNSDIQTTQDNPLSLQKFNRNFQKQTTFEANSLVMFQEYCPKAWGLLRSWRSGLVPLFYAIRWADSSRKIPSRCWVLCNSCHAQGLNKKKFSLQFLLRHTQWRQLPSTARTYSIPYK